jgi:hypothetical protein
MKTFAIVISACAATIMLGCASTDTTTKQAADAQPTKLSERASVTGSRIPRDTTDRVVKSTSRDLADEPVKTIGNEVGARGN